MIEKHIRILKAAIVDALGGPRGDPDRNNLYPAACIVKVLLDEGVSVEEDTLKGLRKDNMYDYDFLAEVEKEFEDIPKAPDRRSHEQCNDERENHLSGSTTECFTS